MKRWTPILILLFLCSSFLIAQDKLEIFGYFESQIMGVETRGDFYNLFSNKLRVDLRSELTENITFAANFDYLTYHGKTEWNILDFLAPNVVSEVPEGM